MKNFSIFFLVLFLVSAGSVQAEDAPVAAPAEAAGVTADTVAAVPTETITRAPEPQVEPVPEAAAVPVENSAVQEPAPAAEPAIDNLEFISGEISALDEAAKTLTVKLYGEAESGAADKALSVTVDDATDITDGEKDRDLRSLTAGTEVDVEYDPATKKATYIFVY